MLLPPIAIHWNGGPAWLAIENSLTLQSILLYALTSPAVLTEVFLRLALILKPISHIITIFPCSPAIKGSSWSEKNIRSTGW